MDKKKVGPPKGSKNAETWTIKEATELFNKAIDLTNDKELNYDFIGEVARDLKQYKEIFNYLSGKFPELKGLHKLIISNCESNCYTSGKTGKIVPSLAIMNLKSNHGWTDRVDNTSKGNEIKQEKTKIIFKGFEQPE